MTVCPCAISKPVLTMFLKWKQETSELTVTPISWQWFGCVVFFFFFLWGFNPILQFTWHNPEGVIWYIWLPILPNTDEGENKKSATRTAGGRLICKQRGRIDESTQTRFRCSSWRRAHATAPEWLSPKKKIFFRLSCLYDLLTGGWLHLMKKISFSSPHPTTCSFVWNKNTAGSFSVTMTYSYICFWIGTYSNLNFLSLVFFCICDVMLHEWSYGLRSSILRLLHGDDGSPMAESPSLSRAFLPGCLRIIN